MKTFNFSRILASILVTAMLVLASSFQAVLAEEVWIDVRSAEEYSADHIEMASNIPHTVIGAEIAKLELAKDADIKLYCRSGGRAGMAKKTLEELGYTNVKNLGGLENVKKLLSD